MGMGSYIKFAWRDAMEIATLLEEHDARGAYDRFSDMDESELKLLERELQPEIRNLIAATPARRNAIVNRIDKSAPGKRYGQMALTFAIIAQVDAMDTLDRMRPGGGNRETCAHCYDISTRGGRVIGDYDFPMEVFDAYGANVDFWGDND